MKTNYFPVGGKNIAKKPSQSSLDVRIDAEAICSTEMNLQLFKGNRISLFISPVVLSVNNFYCQTGINRSKFTYILLILGVKMEEVFTPETIKNDTLKDIVSMELVTPVSNIINSKEKFHSLKVFLFIAQTSDNSAKRPSLYLLRDISNVTFASGKKNSISPNNKLEYCFDTVQSIQFRDLVKWDLTSSENDAMSLAA